MSTLRPSEAAELWTDLRQRFGQSRSRIAQVRRWLTHQQRPSIPEKWTGPADMELQLPHAITTPLQAVQTLGSKRPYLRREPIGGSIVARRRSTQIEQYTNAGLQQIEKQGGPLWLPLVDALFNHGEAALLCYPTPAHWEQFPDFTGSDGKILKRYQRDRDGRDRASAGPGFRVSARASKQAYEEATQDYKARRIPVTARVVTAEECLPVFGPGYRLDALLVLSTYHVDTLREKGYTWLGGEGHPDQGRGAESTTYGSGAARVALLEYWTPGRVCYYVAEPVWGTQADPIPAITRSKVYETGKRGRDGAEQEAVIDLAAEFGITRLPATYLYGAHWAAERDPDLRAIPFLWPFVPSLGAVNNLLTAQGVHAWKYGFGGWFISIEKEIPAAYASVALAEDGSPRTLKLEPMTAQYVVGKPYPAIHPGEAPSVDKLVTVALGAVREESPSDLAFGAPGAESGRDRGMAADLMLSAQAHTLEGARLGWEFLAETFLESATAIARTQDETVPIYVSVRGKAAGDHTRKALELTADLCDDVWDVEAYYRRKKGENLPWAQVLYEYWQGGAIPLRQFLEEGLGDEEPEETMIERVAEDLQFNTEQGRNELYAEAARLMGDEKMAAAFKLQQQGKLAADGTPTQALQPVGGPNPAAPAATGVTAPNPVRSAVGGIVGAEVGQQMASGDVAASPTFGPPR